MPLSRFLFLQCIKSTAVSVHSQHRSTSPADCPPLGFADAPGTRNRTGFSGHYESHLSSRFCDDDKVRSEPWSQMGNITFCMLQLVGIQVKQ